MEDRSTEFPPQFSSLEELSKIFKDQPPATTSSYFSLPAMERWMELKCEHGHRPLSCFICWPLGCFEVK